MHSVRFHVMVNATLQLPMQVQRRAICAISAIANAMMRDPATLDVVAAKVAPQAELEPTLVIRGARKVQEQIENAVERERA